ncbi:MAG: hypothetical protein WBH51_15600 [Mycolicibacter algericus]|uniref:hypothetical protein n=1 Tax=Mycolicibacter algericus TaxID=1288388 RepID=UPI003C72E2E8
MRLVLRRFTDGQFEDPVVLVSTRSPATLAKDMHTYWTDLETVVLCVQDDPRSLNPYFDLGYLNRKFLQLSGEVWLEEE